MIDLNNRKIEYLRISVTDRCNLRCVYCMPDDGIEFIPHSEILSFDEILRIVKISTNLGIKKIKITGGEPLVRRGIIDLIRNIKNVNGIEEVTITTNGLLLKKFVNKLAEIKIDGINVSLDAVDKYKFEQITGNKEIDMVIQGVYEAYDAGIKTKINSLIIPGLNEEQIPELISFTKDKDIQVRFIEVMPIGFGKKLNRFDENDIKNIIEKKFGKLTHYEKKLGNGPAKYYSLTDHIGKIGFISAVSNCFCENCNRVRLTSTGFLKACLHSNYGMELKPLLREGYSDDEIQEAMSDIISNKPKEHRFNSFELTKNIENDIDCGINPKLKDRIQELIRRDDIDESVMSSIGG